MLETLSILPISFWVVIALLIGGGVWSFKRLNDGTGLPLLAVLGTTTAWYVGDAFYNDYANNHAVLFDAATLDGAWWQVAWFIAVVLLASPAFHQWLNRSYLHRPSGVMQMFKHGVNQPVIQRQLNALFRGCALVWIILFLIALLLLKDRIIYYVFPFLGDSASPWSHGMIGAGFDALSVVAMYLQLLAAAMFGVVAALAIDRHLRYPALIFCLLSWPFFIFDRTRNFMLAIVIPAVLCWVFLRLQGRLWKKIMVLLLCYFLVNTWMKFVIAHRSETTISAALRERSLNLAAQSNVHNQGLNMFEELCWISTFIDNGTYHVNWGARYFAELVNPIPRGLWHGKPLIGLDYAIARGMQYGGTDQSEIVATISTGFIGGGVVNFGRFFGPMAAALLMSLWVAILARLDLNIQALGRLPLYSLGMILTFNLGRDITLITLYPFVFGAIVVWWLDRHQPKLAESTPVPRAVPLSNQRWPVASQSLPFVRRVSSGGFVRGKISARPIVPQTHLKSSSTASTTDNPRPELNSPD
jgi:hypothetical protein